MKHYIYKIFIILLFIFSLTSCNEPHTHSTSEYFVDPTCTEDGYQIIETCCSEPKKIIIPALGHTYNEGICVNCGKKALIYIYVINGLTTHTISINYGDKIKIKDFDFLNINDESFDNWYNGDIVYDFNNVVTESFTLSAKYFNMYTVTFVDGDGNILDVEKVIEGESAKTPEAPQKKYYKFIGWDKSIDNITCDTVITAL